MSSIRRQILGLTIPLLLSFSNADAVPPRLSIGSQDTRMQPSSSFTQDENQQLATLITIMRGKKVHCSRVLGTGSMRPAIGDDDVFLLEECPYEALQIGDIIEWRDEGHTAWIEGKRETAQALHRIVAGKPGAWIVRGDNNRNQDDIRVGPKQFIGRVCGVLYSKKPVTK